MIGGDPTERWRSEAPAAHIARNRDADRGRQTELRE
jgi:hypothetical protein